MMTRQELANEIARGLVETGVEGGYDAVTCSTAGDYPSIGCSQWEGGRAEDLLSRIPNGDQYAGRSYSDIDNAGELGDLAALLDSEAGRDAQMAKLAEDCLDYVDALWEVSDLDQSRCLIYAGMWCPTSTLVVQRFCQRRQDRGYDLRDLDTLYALFKGEYADAAGCGDYSEGYQNRADMTYTYVSNLDLGMYGE